MKSSENQIKWITYYNNKKQIHIIPKSGLKLLLNGEKKTPSIPTNMSFFRTDSGYIMDWKKFMFIEQRGVNNSMIIIVNV
jgi:hypothetical protein